MRKNVIYRKFKYAANGTVYHLVHLRDLPCKHCGQKTVWKITWEYGGEKGKMGNLHCLCKFHELRVDLRRPLLDHMMKCELEHMKKEKEELERRTIEGSFFDAISQLEV